MTDRWTRDDDLRVIQNPHEWAHDGEVCPIKRRLGNGKSEVAYLRDSRPVIWHGNIFDDRPDMHIAELFESHEAILAAGWEVD